MEQDPNQGNGPMSGRGDLASAGRLMHLHRSLLFPCRKRMREVSLQYRRVPHRIFRSMAVGRGVCPSGADGAMVSVAADAQGYKKIFFLSFIMKVAIAKEGDIVSEHFGHCTEYAVFVIEKSKITSQ